MLQLWIQVRDSRTAWFAVRRPRVPEVRRPTDQARDIVFLCIQKRLPESGRLQAHRWVKDLNDRWCIGPSIRHHPEKRD